MKGVIRMRHSIWIVALAALTALTSTASAGLPVGFEAKGGIGIGYYSMSDLNDHLSSLRQTINANAEDVGSDFNVFIEGRVWMFQRVAGLVGYEHYWTEAALNTTSQTLKYTAPADVFYLGGAINIVSVPMLVEINAGVRGTFAKVVYGENEESETRLSEYKANDYGWDIFAEVNTNFFKPIEVGFTLGYRNLKVSGFEDKYGHEPVFSTTGEAVAIEYSGMFFYLTAGIALW
jgi:hypothetical protein